MFFFFLFFSSSSLFHDYDKLGIPLKSAKDRIRQCNPHILVGTVDRIYELFPSSSCSTSMSLLDLSKVKLFIIEDIQSVIMDSPSHGQRNALDHIFKALYLVAEPKFIGVSTFGLSHEQAQYLKTLCRGREVSVSFICFCSFIYSLFLFPLIFC